MERLREANAKLLAQAEAKNAELERELQAVRAEHGRMQKALQDIVGHGYVSAKFSDKHEMVEIIDWMINRAKDGLG